MWGVFDFKLLGQHIFFNAKINLYVYILRNQRRNGKAAGRIALFAEC